MLRKTTCILISALMLCLSPATAFAAKQTAPSATTYERRIADSIRKVPVQSTCFSEVGYSRYYQVLFVTFKDSGKSYLYFDVPYEKYREMIDNYSIGGYYNRNIKGHYDCSRLD